MERPCLKKVKKANKKIRERYTDACIVENEELWKADILGCVASHSPN